MIGWPANVNKVIIDSTTIAAGEASVENTTESGLVDVYLKSSFVPDVINVTMDFDFFEKDENGLTEYDRFMRWFKFVHRHGTRPFEFPTIAKYGKENLAEMSSYRIVSPPQQQKRGLAFRTTMTWKEEFKEIVRVAVPVFDIDSFYAENGILTVAYTSIPSETPTTTKYSFSLSDMGTQIPLKINRVEMMDNKALFYFNQLQEGNYIISFSDGTKEFTTGLTVKK